MGLESMMKMLMQQKNEKKVHKKKVKPPSPSKDPNRQFLKDMVLNFSKSDSSLIRYDFAEMTKLLDQLQAEVREQPTLLELESPINVCGDIHGQMQDLRRIFMTCGFPSQKKYLFLGDYVDRGNHSVEVVCVLAAWKLLFPKNVFLLRGNHELAHINKEYGFLDEVIAKWIDPEDGKMMYGKFNEVFSYFPLAAVIAEKILCMHGGLSPALNSLEDIRRISRPITTPRGLAQDMLWADPSHNVVGFKHNSMRAVSVNFGESEVRERLKKLGVSKMIRAHQVAQYGWECFASGAVITVFSACRYQEEPCNCGAVVVIKKNLAISFVVIKPSDFDEQKSNIKEPMTMDPSGAKKAGSSSNSSENNHRNCDENLKTMPSFRGKTGDDEEKRGQKKSPSRPQ